MSLDNADLSSNPPEPMAGQLFTLTIRLDSASPADITVSLEKQRIVAKGGGPQLFPTGTNYFQLNPQPITIIAGTTSGTSSPIEVKSHPSAEPGDPPVRSPERLLFSAFIPNKPSDGFCCTIVPVSVQSIG